MTEQEVEKLNQGRLLREAGQILLPILNQMRARVLARVVLCHRDGDATKLPAAAAELSVIEELTNKITRNDRETAQREARVYDQTE